MRNRASYAATQFRVLGKCVLPPIARVLAQTPSSENCRFLMYAAYGPIDLPSVNAEQPKGDAPFKACARRREAVRKLVLLDATERSHFAS